MVPIFLNVLMLNIMQAFKKLKKINKLSIVQILYVLLFYFGLTNLTYIMKAL